MASVPYQTVFVGVSFTGAEIEVNPVAGTAETWEYDTEIGKPSATAREVVESIATWCQGAGRNWSGSWAASATYADAGDEGLMLGLTGTASGTTWTPNATLAAALDWSTVTDLSIRSAAGVPSTLQTEEIWLDRLYRVGETEGHLAGSAAWHTTAIKATPRSARVQWVMTPAQAMRLSELAVSRIATSPRVCEVYDDINSDWQRLCLGDWGRDDGTLTHYVFRPSVMEAP